MKPTNKVRLLETTFNNLNTLKMKHLLLIIAVLLSVNCIAQNRFEKEFKKADIAFTSITDSLKFNQVIKIIESDSVKITLTKEQCLLLYFSGYINGSFSYKEKGSFDFDGLLFDIKREKRLIKNKPF